MFDGAVIDNFAFQCPQLLDQTWFGWWLNALGLGEGGQYDEQEDEKAKKGRDRGKSSCRRRVGGIGGVWERKMGRVCSEPFVREALAGA